DPLLLMLDEPIAALDARAEHQLFQSYSRTARTAGRRTGSITLLVSHRFSTVRMADLILVLADGRIAEAGSHDDLIQNQGLYSELYRLQADQYRERPSLGCCSRRGLGSQLSSSPTSAPAHPGTKCAAR